MAAIEEFRERLNEIRSEAHDENQVRRHSIELVRDIEIAKKGLSEEDALPYHELVTEIGRVVFGVGVEEGHLAWPEEAAPTEAAPKGPTPEQRRDAARAERDRREAKEQALAQTDREFRERLADRAVRTAEIEADGNKHGAERARDHLERARVEFRKTIAIGVLMILGVIGVLFTLWFFFHGPSASEQLEDRFRQSCIDKGWTYDVETSNDDFAGTAHGDCVAPR